MSGKEPRLSDLGGLEPLPSGSGMRLTSAQDVSYLVWFLNLNLYSMKIPIFPGKYYFSNAWIHFYWPDFVILCLPIYYLNKKRH